VPPSVFLHRSRHTVFSWMIGRFNGWLFLTHASSVSTRFIWWLHQWNVDIGFRMDVMADRLPLVDNVVAIVGRPEFATLNGHA